MSSPYPWLAPHWDALVSQARANTLGHAYFVSGPKGLGKFEFASRFSHWLLCEAKQADGIPCGECGACRLLNSESHPDLKIVKIEDDHRSLLVDQIREIGTYYTLKSHAGGAKITVINDADTMNHHAANALLKILEEPPSGALIMLLASHAGVLPQTILSRCQRIEFRTGDAAEIDTWLRSQCSQPALERLRRHSFSGTPLQVLVDLESEEPPILDLLVESLQKSSLGEGNPIEFAAKVAANDHNMVLANLDLLVRIMILNKLDTASPRLYLTDKSSKTLRETANKLNSKRLFLFLDHISGARSMVRRSSGVRPADVIENLYYEWAQLARMENG